jgi:hypothetical protein
VRRYLQVQGIVVTLLALALLFAPQFMMSLWPWNITLLLAQIYASPFLAYGLSSLMTSRQQTWQEAQIVIMATFIFVFGVLLASLLHRQLFVATRIATWLWFGGFLLTTIMLGLLTSRAIRARSTT